MRRLLLLASVALCLSLASASAQADVITPTPPAPSVLAGVETIVTSYWMDRVGVALPQCGQPQVHYVDNPDPWVGLTFYNAQDPCGIEIKVDATWQLSTLCGVLTHEWGHLILGRDYFAATNPADPMHSPNPTDVMYRQVGDRNVPPGCTALDVPPPAPSRARQHHRRHRTSASPHRRTARGPTPRR